MTRFLIIDDHAIVRRGLRQVLGEGFPEARLDEASTAADGLALLSRETYDLLFLDVNLPGRSGLEMLEDVRRTSPRLPVLMVSAYPEEEFAIRCFRLGAAGYVAKEAAVDELVHATRRALAGGKYVTAALAEQLAAAVGGEVLSAPHESLSPREMQVLRLVARGCSAKEIAAELHVSERTVATYRARIAEKLGISTSVELTRYALQNGLSD
jgi:two-component system, NarL family, invasion response regulator UvrY